MSGQEIERLRQELRIARFDAAVPLRELREENERLREAIGEYLLWRPGWQPEGKGHAAALRRLTAVWTRKEIP